MVFEGDELEIMRKVIHESEYSDSESGLIDWGKIDRQYEEQRLVTPGLSYQDFLKTVRIALLILITEQFVWIVMSGRQLLPRQLLPRQQVQAGP